MAKIDFTEIAGKLKNNATEMVGKVQKAATQVIKDTQEKIAKKPKTPEDTEGLKEMATKTEELSEDEKALNSEETIDKNHAPSENEEAEASEETGDGNSAEKSAPKKDKTQKESEPKVKIDEALKKALDEYNEAYTTMNDNGVALYRERTRAVDMITHIENLVNSIANRPKDFDTDIAEIQTKKKDFVEICEYAKAELETATKSAMGAGVGLATGAAVASIAPSVALWVATTFGTASTGTAISVLSGAAAQSAALAWLGGGTLAAGGGGMAMGNAFLALAGPVGWGIAGASLLSSIVLFSVSKVKMDKKKKEEMVSVKNNTALTKKTAAQIQVLLDEVIELRNHLEQQYNSCLSEYGKDFTEISREQLMRLGAMVNSTKALAASLSRTIQ